MDAGADRDETEVIRLAVVMNGGVSLAVWMGGVTHELDRLLDRGLGAETSPAWQAILAEPSQAYGRKTPRQRRVVVDYVAGTSAGGLNGTLLATALARSAPLQPLRDLWLSSAKLTEDALLPESGQRGTALLDGEFFHDKILETLGDITPSRTAGRDPVTLLVTSTALTAPRLDVEDAHDHQFKVSDRRRVYKFESGARTTDGRGTFEDAGLALAARASASFPAAFEPVEESPELAARRVDSWSLKVRAQAAQASPAEAAAPTWLIDGGVLDNAPFEPLLEEMGQQPPLDDDERWVVYVVPSAPGLSGTSDRVDEGAGNTTEPPMWLDVIKKLWGLKGEVDLRADVEALRRLQEEARERHHRPERLIGAAPAVPATVVAGGLLPLYRRTRARGFAQYYVGATSGKLRLERREFATSYIDDLLESPAYFVPTDLSPTRNDRWQWGTTVAARLALWMAREARRRSVPEHSLRRLRRARGVLEQLHIEMTEVIVGAAAPGEEDARIVLLERAEQIDSILSRVSPVIEEAVGVWASSLPGPGGTEGIEVDEAWTRLLTTEVLLSFAEWHGHTSLPEFDVVLVDTGARQIVDLLRSAYPSLAAELERRPDGKLYGTSLGHFGAFGHTSYREHDWAWGRIDGAVCLATALLKSVDGERRRQLTADLVLEVLLDDDKSRVNDPTVFETLCASTVEALEKSNAGLLVDTLKGGEIDIGSAVSTVLDAADRAFDESTLGALIETVVDEVAHDLRTAGDTVEEAATRLRRGLFAVARKAARLLKRVWPG